MYWSLVHSIDINMVPFSDMFKVDFRLSSSLKVAVLVLFLEFGLGDMERPMINLTMFLSSFVITNIYGYIFLVFACIILMLLIAWRALCTSIYRLRARKRFWQNNDDIWGRQDNTISILDIAIRKNLDRPPHCSIVGEVVDYY